MLEDRYLRIGLVASLIVNGGAVSFLGYSNSLKAMSRQTSLAAKPHASRLIEIAMLAEDKQKTDGKQSDAKSEKDGTGGDGAGKDGSLSDSDTGPLGKLNQGPLAKTRPAGEKAAPPKPILASLTRKNSPKPASAKKGAKPASSQSTVKRNIKLAIKSNLKLDLGTLHLKKPGGLITGGYHGTVDLRNVKISGHLIADVGKNPSKPLPNKMIGTSHIKIVAPANPGTNALCIPTGGHTIYASDMTILLGTNSLTGTKFCVPGGFPGVPGSASQTDPTGFISELYASSNASGGAGSKDQIYQEKAVDEQRPAAEQSGDSSAKANSRADGSGSKASGASKGSDGRAYAPVGKGGELPDGEKSEAEGGSDTGTSTQQTLENRYEQLARGPLRGISDPIAGGGLVAYNGGAPTRALHLPEFHNDPTDRIPGVLVPKDQQKLVVSPKAHRGSAAQKSGAKEQTDLKLTHFDLSPMSVGSHSSHGDVLWAPDSKKAVKHKASRRVKGDGTVDGGGDGSGLMGTYFLGMDFEKEVFSRPDRNIDFDWSGWRPDPRIRYPQPFSVRWKGKIRSRYSETYTISSASDDGVRIWIGGRLILSNWTIHAATEDPIRIKFEAGREYDFKLEYFENDTDPAIMKLYWESPSQAKESIPQSCFVYPRPKG
jgi:hypothetical protein